MNLAWFLRAGWPDKVLGELRSSLHSERVFTALLVSDPDGFLNP
jgi:hypothetical protein